MAKTYNAVIPAGLCEENGTRSENYSTTEFSATVTYLGPWAVRDAYVDALRYTVFPVTKRNAVAHYSYYQPASVQSISIQPVGMEGQYKSPTGTAIQLQPYSVAKYTVQYKGMARPDNCTVQEQVQPSVSMRQIPSFGYYWYSDGSPVLDKEAPAIRENRMTINRTITGVRMLPEFFFSLAGHVNSNVWQDSILGRVFLPGTLLFTPSNVDRQMTFANDNDDYLWTFSYSLEWNPIGWNNFQRPHAVDTMMYSVPVASEFHTDSSTGLTTVEVTAWDGVPMQLFPVAYFPSMVFDPNSSDVSEWMLEEFDVRGTDEDGSIFIIHVGAEGDVHVP